MTTDGAPGTPAPGVSTTADHQPQGADLAGVGAGGPVDAAPDPLTTGHPTIDAAMRDLAGLRDASPADQLPALQAVHRALQEALASIDQQ